MKSQWFWEQGCSVGGLNMYSVAGVKGSDSSFTGSRVQGLRVQSQKVQRSKDRGSGVRLKSQGYRDQGCRVEGFNMCTGLRVQGQ